jgi:hypothetical protein
MLNLLGLLGSSTPLVTWEANLGDDGEGRSTYATAVLCDPVRVTPHSKMIQLPDGRVVTASHIVSVPGNLTPTPGDRVTINGTTARVWGVDTPVWLDGTAMHHKLTVGPG